MADRPEILNKGLLVKQKQALTVKKTVSFHRQTLAAIYSL